MYKFFRFLDILVLLSCLFIFSCKKDTTGHIVSPVTNWEFSTPEDQGLDSDVLSGAFVEFESLGYVDCILIIKNGKIVAEQYYNGYDKDIAHNVKSVSKSFLSALTGIALREGYLDSLNQKMVDFFPEYAHYVIDDRQNDINIRDLLMMRAGLDHERNNYSQLYQNADWIRATLELTLFFDPGSTFSYNTFQTHLLSAILTKASGMNTFVFFEKFLLDPLHISLSRWQQGPQGYYFGGNNMYFTPRDMAKLGYLYLNNGNINGEQIIPSKWIEESLTNYTGFTNYNWGDLHDVNYGYLWWLGEMDDYEVFLAVGYGGQIVFNLPELNMIVVTTAETAVDWDTSDSHIGSIMYIIAHNILPAILK
jgi:CubicO group peptidase (beta-lactamase class C family)